MISERMASALNAQVNAELYSAYLYLSMGAYFESLGLAGFGYWMRVQALEETYHGVKLYDYVVSRGGRAVMEAIDKPQTEWESPVAAFENVLAHEKKVTGLINDLAKVAEEEKDGEASEFLKWFVKEQEEEEESAEEVLNLVREAGKDLEKADSELAGRTFKIPKDIKIKFRNPPN
jgi:ferritin